MEFDEDANKDGRLTDAENRGGDNDTGTTTIVVTVPTDGNIKVGDKVVIRDEDGNKVAEKEITQGDLDNGGKVTINGVPINTGANNPFVAEIVNPNNPTNPSEPIIGNIDVAEILAITAVTDNEAGGIQDGNNVLGVNGGLTNDKTPTIKGTADKGSTVKIYDNGEYIGETIADANGKWEFTPALEKEGVHKFTAKAGDSTSNEAVINLDATMKIEFSVDLTIDDCSKPGANAAPIFTKEQTTNNSDLLIINHWLDNNTTVDLKGGNDDLFVGGRVVGKSVINAGEGNDRINIDDSLGWGFGKGTVNLGDGGDTKVIKTHIHGKTSDGDTDYIVKGENGNVIYEGTTDSNGNFDVWLANVVKPGENITIEMTDKAGNSGKASNKAHAFDTDGNRYYNNELLVGTDIHDGKVTAGDGNDKVVVGTKGGSKHITAGSNINLGNGDNELIVGTNIAGSRVAAGNGDDIVTVGQWKHPGDSWISDGSIVDLGDGNNRLTVGTNIDLSRVTTGSGDDIVKVGGHITNKSIMDLGDGSNHLTVGTNIDHSRVTTGSGDDIVKIDGHIWNSKDESRSNHPGEADYSINLGDGKNTLTVEAEVKWSSITTGSGDDKLEFKTYMLDSKVETGSGSDTIKVGTYVEKSTINLGDGKDTIEVGYFKGNNNNIDGGEGYDRLILTNQADNKGNIDLSHIAKQAHNFEELNISNGQAGTTLKIGLKDVVDLTDDNNILKISGDAGDAVSFKEQGWSKGGSDNGYTSYTNNFNGKTVTIQIEDEIIRPM